MSYGNFLGIPPEFSSEEKSRAVILPIPFDLTSTFRKGADRGPEALIAASQNLELYDIETRSEPYRVGIYTASPIHSSSAEEMVEKSYQTVKAWLDRGKFVLTLGGEHSISNGPIRAHAERYPGLSVLQLDAHSDMRDTYEGTPLNHACIMARAQEVVSTVVSVGVRSQDVSELARVEPSKMFYAEDILFRDQPQRGWMENVIEQLSRQVYVTIDLDVFDIGIMPSTGTPEPGGLGWYEVITLLRKVAESRDIVGCDIVELCPGPNPAPDFMAAKLAYKLLSYKFSLAARG